MMKVPYMFIVGAKEAEENTVSLRRHGEGDIGTSSIDEAVKRLQDEISARGLLKENN